MGAFASLTRIAKVRPNLQRLKRPLQSIQPCPGSRLETANSQFDSNRAIQIERNRTSVALVRGRERHQAIHRD